MRRTICRIGLCLVVAMTGCSSIQKLTSKEKPASNSATVQQASAQSPNGQDAVAPTKPPNPVKVHLAYAAWHEQSGNYQEAHESYQKVLEKDRKNVEAILGLARVDRAYGREAEADKQLKKALKYHPKDPKVFVAMGQVHAARKEWPEAIEKMRQAHELAPYDTIYHYHLAVVEARSGDIPQAMDHFSRSVGEAEAHFNIAVILNEQGDRTEAENHLMKAVELKPELKQAHAALASLRSEKDDLQPVSFSKKNPASAVRSISR